MHIQKKWHQDKLAKSLFEIFNDKVSLIYEYDKSSPLFVRKANSEITKNNVDEAIDILLNGIRNYSDYPTAYIILGKAYTLKGLFKDAEEAYKKGSALIYSDSTYDFYMKEIEYSKTDKLIFNSDRGSAFLMSNNNLNENYQFTEIGDYNESITNESNNIIIDKFDEEKVNKDKLKNEHKDTTNSDNIFEENLDELASEISSAKMPEIDNSKINNVSTKEFVNDDDPMIVSETLAKIYEAQNEYSEAIKVYEKLMIKHPDKKEEYTNKIISLKSINDNPSD